MQARARELRRDMTPAEKKLWGRLRYGQPGGAHFRRQHAAGRSIVDFLCAKAKLAVELDGGVHETRIDLDAERDRRMKEQNGWRVLRFKNVEIMSNLDAVLEKIAEAVKETTNEKKRDDH